MLTFHYIICNIKRKERYHAKKLIFIDQKLEKTDDLNLTDNQLIRLKSEIDDNLFTEINDDQINLDSFLKNINLIYPIKD
tara:strand:- start:777 stop:1016 length:240 start_codon:yes stop_codon:yes gene_type:complete